MSAEFLQHLVNANLPKLGCITANGECRLLKRSSPDAVSDQGFINQDTTPRFSEYWPCNWAIQAEKSNVAGEQNAAMQVRSVIEYEITVLQAIERLDVLAQSDDLLELKVSKTPGAAVLTLQITAVVNQTNGAWFILATDTNA